MVEGQHQGAEQRRQARALVRPESGQQLLLVVEQCHERRVDAAAAVVGEPDEHSAAVVGIGAAVHEATAGEPVDAVGHRAAGHQRLVQQPARGELVGPAGPAQSGEYVELPRLELVGGKRLATRAVEVAGQPGDSAENVHRRDIEVGTFPLPRLDQPVDLVLHPSSVAVKILDIDSSRVCRADSDHYCHAMDDADLSVASASHHRGYEARDAAAHLEAGASTMSHSWDPGTYLAFADERSRPFFDLLARVAGVDPAYVVDLGCGPGQLTATLAARWPDARVEGIDSSEAMIAEADAHATSRIRFTIADLRDWRPDAPVDVLVSNATLQWVPDHLALLPRLVEHLRPGGWLAFQVPGNFTEPSHTLLRGLAADSRFAAHTRTVSWPASHQPVGYLGALQAHGCAVDAWETTYLHVLTGPDPVLRWISGTGARPVLQALPPDVRRVFEQEYAAALREAYPPRSFGTVLPFRRIFVVAQKES